MRAVALLVLTAALAACSDPREAELAQELVALQEARTPRTSFEKMAAEVRESEASLATLGAEIDALRPQVEHGQAEAVGAEAAYQREVERNTQLNQEIQTGQQRLQEAAARQAALEQEITIAQARAQTFKDQAATLVKELRPDDPEWAQKLRIQSLREFLTAVGDTWPRDPVLAEVAKTALPADGQEATRVGAALAARIRDRVSEVYGLAGDEARGNELPAVAAEPATS